ncbi:dipeptidase [Sedimentibacter sp. MB31-C6]|uniref:dipeptidase n=1 Tax=Sedimentibacter sp. MB31-C6 TaxID=3109366 RepID=UPI002DDD9B8C|nr:dipeptidase [Sedimentibacter sp. MB36-C1]WSI03543.1 dipeptidase [Sedimentibacter sp. MB36-C1]
MIVFDSHSDLWIDILRKNRIGEKDVFKTRYLKAFQDGEVIGGIFVIWVDPPFTAYPVERSKDVIRNMAKELNNNTDIMRLIRNYDDIEKSLKDKKMPIMMGIEGMNFMEESVDYLDVLYLMGARHAMLTWNEENIYATGSRGNKNRGLTEKGIEVVKRMEKLGMIIDVSHANEKTFWDIVDNTTGPIIASHSNVRRLCDTVRNLTDEQCKVIANRNGVIGMNSYDEFVSKDKAKKNLDGLIDHIDYLQKLIGIDHICFGFDFMNYLNSPPGEDESVIGLEDVSQTQNIINAMRRRGYLENDIEKVAYKNIFRVIKDVLD